VIRAALLVMAGAAASGGTPKSAFWVEHEAEYRASPRGPFTAVHAVYVGADEAARVLAGADSIWSGTADHATGDALAGMEIRMQGDGFAVSPLAGLAAPTSAGTPIAGEVLFPDGADEAEDVRLGRFLLTLTSQGGGIGRALIYDPRRLEDFHGFDVFPDQDAFRVPARVEPVEPASEQLGTTRGLVRTLERAALLEFEVEGTPCRLTAYREPGTTDTLFVAYRDASSGGETYGVGRYLRVPMGRDGRTVIDFNRSTNPWCAYSPFYNCVLPPESNVLPVAILAGERSPAGH